MLRIWFYLTFSNTCLVRSLWSVQAFDCFTAGRRQRQENIAISIGSIYNVSNCNHFIGNGCEESSLNFLRCFYCLLKTGCRNFTDSSGVYIYCSNPYTASDSFSIASLREPISHPLHLRFKDMMSVSAVGWVLMAPWCASEIKFQDQKKNGNFPPGNARKLIFCVSFWLQNSSL